MSEESYEPNDSVSHLLSWPEVPTELRPKPLYHELLLAPEIEERLVAKGYKPIDVRLLQGADQIEAILAGIAMQTIKRSSKDVKFFEIAARATGLTSVKERQQTQKAQRENRTVQELLDSFKSFTANSVKSIYKALQVAPIVRYGGEDQPAKQTRFRGRSKAKRLMGKE